MRAVYRARSPLRLGLAGGGTDVSPYCDLFGGCVLNATIDMYIHATVEPLAAQEVQFFSLDLGEEIRFPLSAALPLENPFILHRAVYNRICKEFNDGKPLAVRVSTKSEAPPGSGLGSSSTLVVSMIQAFQHWLKLPLGEYDIAHLAYEIERNDAQMSGGKQDQYATTFGGVNFIEFHADDHVIVNPLRVNRDVMNELESSLVLYYTGVSRQSSNIIREQIKSAREKDSDAHAAMHELKEMAFQSKRLLLRGNIVEFGKLLDESWEAKKRTAKAISNSDIDDLYSAAKKCGIYGGKVSGAGGGGFMMFLIDPLKRTALERMLGDAPGKMMSVHFTEIGSHSWKRVVSEA